MVIMAPNNISLLIMLVHDISKHLVRPFVSIKLGLEAASCCKPIFLRKPKIVKEWPQDIVAVAVIVLMYNFFIKKYWNASLFSNEITAFQEAFQNATTIVEREIHNKSTRLYYQAMKQKQLHKQK